MSSNKYLPVYLLLYIQDMLSTSQRYNLIYPETYLEVSGHPLESNTNSKPTIKLVFESYVSLGVIAVASSDSHTFFSTFILSKYSLSSWHRRTPSFTVTSLWMYLPKKN